ncbi:MAG: class I SAM-dependent methyltransferase [Bullifex sp.]
MWWSDEKIRLYEKAASASSFHKDLASIIITHLEKGESIVELGCGLGYITNELYTRGFDVTGLDTDEKAISFAKEHFPSSRFMLADAYGAPIIKDVALAVFFGRIREEDNLDVLLSSCTEKLIYIQNEHAGSGDTDYAKSLETEEYLKSRNVNYTLSLHRLSFNQPLSSAEEAESFIKENYKNRKNKTSIEKTDDGYIAINRKAFGLFVIHKEDK